MEQQISPERQAKWYASSFKTCEKVVEGKPVFTVLGYFTSDQVDQVGDIITKDATLEAVTKWRAIGNIRYMHQPRPIGKVLRIGEEDELEWNQVEFKVVDPEVQNLIREGVLGAMSVGISVKSAEPVDPENASDPFWFMSGGMRITGYDMIEISVVDHPANLDAMLTQTSKSDQPLKLKVIDLDSLVAHKSIDAPTVEDTVIKESGMEETKDAGAKQVEAPALEETQEEVTKAEGEQPTSEPPQGNDPVMAKLDELMAKLEEVAANVATLCEEPADEPTEETDGETVPEEMQAQKTEEVKAQPEPTKESVKAVDAKDELTGMVKSLQDSLAQRDEALFERVKQYIEELRKPAEGKAALKTEPDPEPRKNLREMSPDERRKALKDKLAQAFNN